MGFGSIGLGALVGGLGGLFSSRSAKRQAKFQKGNLEQSLGFFQQAGREEELFGSLAQNQLQSSLSGITEAFGRSKEELSRVGAGQKEAVVQRERELAADLQQEAISSGLQGSTVPRGERRSLKRDTDLALSSIDSQLAQMFIDLELGQASAEAGARADLAGLFSQRGSSSFNLAGAQAGLISGQQFIPGQNTFESILAGGLGGALGGFGGG